MKRPGNSSIKEKQQQQAREKQVLKDLQSKSKQQEKLVVFLAFIVAAVGLVLYINTLGHQFALDDYSLILENKSTQKGFAGLKEIFKTTYRFGYVLTGDELYRPLSKAIFAIQWELAPKNPFPGHLINILLYALTGFVMMRVLMNYLQSVSIAFIASLLFIAHPIHTEVVANIKSLDEILALLFNLLTLNCIYLHSKKNSVKYLLYSFACFFLALLSKESSITFLAVFVLAWFFFQKESWSVFMKPTGAIALSLVIFMLIRKSVTGGAVSLTPSAADNLIMSAPDAAHRFATAVYIFGLYILKLIIPHPLAFDYSYGQIPVVGMNDWRFLLTIVILIGVSVLAILQLKKKRIWVFGFLSFLAVASVASNIIVIIGTNMGERLMYGPSFGFCIMIAGLVSAIPLNDTVVSAKELLQKNSKVFIPLGIVLLLFSIKTIARNPVWENNYTLYSNDVKVSPNSTRTHYYLGNLLIKDDMVAGKDSIQRDSIIREGIKELEKSVAIYSKFTDAWNQMGVAYWKLKNFDKARSSYEMALQQNPGDATVHSNIGTIFFQTGNFPEAYKAFTKATQLNPYYSDAFLNLGSVNGMMNQLDQAIAAFNRCVELDPNNAMAWYYLGITYQNMGNTVKAQECFSRQQQLQQK